MTPYSSTPVYLIGGPNPNPNTPLLLCWLMNIWDQHSTRNPPPQKKKKHATPLSPFNGRSQNTSPQPPPRLPPRLVRVGRQPRLGLEARRRGVRLRREALERWEGPCRASLRQAFIAFSGPELGPQLCRVNGKQTNPKKGENKKRS